MELKENKEYDEEMELAELPDLITELDNEQKEYEAELEQYAEELAEAEEEIKKIKDSEAQAAAMKALEVRKEMHQKEVELKDEAAQSLEELKALDEELQLAEAAYKEAFERVGTEAGNESELEDPRERFNDAAGRFQEISQRFENLDLGQLEHGERYRQLLDSATTQIEKMGEQVAADREQLEEQYKVVIKRLEQN